MNRCGKQRGQRQLIQIHTCFIVKIKHRATGFPQELQQLNTREGKDLSELQDRKRGIRVRKMLVVVVHQDDAEREELVEHHLPIGIFQERRKREHGLDGSLLPLEFRAATRTERELLRDIQVNQQDGSDIEGRRSERVLRCFLNEFLE